MATTTTAMTLNGAILATADHVPSSSTTTSNVNNHGGEHDNNNECKEDSNATTKLPSPSSPLKAPRRPLSAYNYFFQDQRAKILGDQIVSQEEEHDTDVTTGNKKRKHRKAHGKIGFTALARHVGAAWKALGKDDRKVYEDKFKEDKARYQRELVEYEDKLNNLIHLAQVKKALKTLRAQEAEKAAAAAASEEKDDEDTSGETKTSDDAIDAQVTQIAAMTMPGGNNMAFVATGGMMQQQAQAPQQQSTGGVGGMQQIMMMNQASNQVGSSITMMNNTSTMNHDHMVNMNIMNNQANFYNNNQNNGCNNRTTPGSSGSNGSCNSSTSHHYPNTSSCGNNNTTGMNGGGAMSSMMTMKPTHWNPFANFQGASTASSFSSLLSQAIWFSRGGASSGLGGGNAITTAAASSGDVKPQVQTSSSTMMSSSQQPQPNSMMTGGGGSCPDHHSMLHRQPSERYNFKRRCSLDRTAVPGGHTLNHNMMMNMQGNHHFPEYHDVMPSTCTSGMNFSHGVVSSDQGTTAGRTTGTTRRGSMTNTQERGGVNGTSKRAGGSPGSRTTQMRRCSAPSAACFTAARSMANVFDSDEDEEPTKTTTTQTQTSNAMENNDEDDDMFCPIPLEKNDGDFKTKLRNSIHECEDMKHIMQSIARWDSARVIQSEAEEDEDMKPHLPTLDISAASNLDVDFPSGDANTNADSNSPFSSSSIKKKEEGTGIMTMMEMSNQTIVSDEDVNATTSLDIMFEKTAMSPTETQEEEEDEDDPNASSTIPLEEEGMDNDTLDFLQEFVYDDSIVA